MDIEQAWARSGAPVSPRLWSDLQRRGAPKLRGLRTFTVNFHPSCRMASVLHGTEKYVTLGGSQADCLRGKGLACVGYSWDRLGSINLGVVLPFLSP